MFLNDDYKLESDELNVTLYQRGLAKSGNEYWRPIAFFNNVQNALHSIVKRKLKGTGLKDLEEIARVQQELHDIISRLQLPSRVV